jgi:hypothetical protein
VSGIVWLDARRRTSEQLKLSPSNPIRMEAPCADSVALSPNGHTLAVGANSGDVELVDARTGRAGRSIGQGLLPVWSRDGKTLYFERREPGKLLHCDGPELGWRLIDGITYTATPAGPEYAYTTSLWRLDAARPTSPTRIDVKFAYGFGPARPLAGGPGLVYSGVLNSSEFCGYPLVPAGTRVRVSGPQVFLQVLSADGRSSTLKYDAGRPQV